MKRILTLLFLSLITAGSLWARQVDEQTAARVAARFLAQRAGAPAKAQVRLLTTGTALQSGQAINTYYVFDINDRNGFVVVSGDDIVKPILAYSLANEFQAGSEQSPETRYWMGLYRDQVSFAVQHNLKASQEVRDAWQQYLTDDNGGVAAKPTNVVVAPLLTTRWNQGTYYNIYTPGSGSGKTPVGCVATAMAQIMKYWEAPTTGTGSYSYNHSAYGNLSADFGATTYPWGLMPNVLSASSPLVSKQAVSLISYHCAISVKMDFAPGGSGSYVLAWSSNARCAENAFKNHFGYKSTIEGLSRDLYNDQQWDSILKHELDQARPMLYAGFGAAGGHAFVFDGYDDQGMFHINWGWGGMSDGYFTVDNLAPSALGIGGGAGNFNDGQQVLINIEPEQPGDTLNLVMNSALALSAASINQGDPLSVTANIRNRGTFDFSGLFGAAIYKAADSSLAAYVQYYNNQILFNGNDTSITFSHGGLTGLTGGDYFVKILYRRVNGNAWKVLPDDAGFTNRAGLTVTGTTTRLGTATLEKQFGVYPNPAREQVTLDISAFAGKVQEVRLYSLQGRKLSDADASGKSLVTIPVAQLASGLYYLHIVTDQGVAIKKVTVRH